MKLLVLIDSQRFEIEETAAFEISYNKYKDFDAVIIIDSVKEATASEGVVDVRKPSGEGVPATDSNDFPPRSLEDFYPTFTDNPIHSERINKKVFLVREEEIPLSKLEIINSKLVLSSDNVGNLRNNIYEIFELLPGSCEQLAAREKEAVGDNYLYIHEEPVVKVDEKKDYSYCITEVVSVIKRESVEAFRQKQPATNNTTSGFIPQ